MKSKLKMIYRIIAVLTFVIAVCLIFIFIPPVTAAVSRWTGIAADKITSTMSMVFSSAVGLLLISFGVTALAALPIVGAILIGIGVVILIWALWPLFSSKPKPALNNLGTN